MVGVMKIMETSFKKSHVLTATLSAPDAAAGHYRPTPPTQIPGHSQANLAQSPAAAKSLQLCPTLHDPIDGSPPGSPSLGFSWVNTGVGCHFLLHRMKVKSESEVAQSCPTLSDPMDCSLPGSSVHGIFQARVLEWGAITPLDSLNSSTIRSVECVNLGK